ncbi:MAG TPA: ABC transporter permease, partial [Actinomycetota bacterium]|nr:ABC transporter permease [Actinomycetota bacterium]
MNLPARLAAGRIAGRQMRRNPGRTALVMALVGLPIAALVFGLIVARTERATPEQGVAAVMGSADGIAYLPTQDGQASPTDPGTAAVLALLPPGSRAVPLASSDFSVVKGGTLHSVTISQPGIPISQPPAAGMLPLISGQAPRAPGEVALSPGLLGLFRTRLGATVAMDGMTLRVVGTVENPTLLDEQVAVLGPGTLTGATSAYLLTFSQPLTAAEQQALSTYFGPGGLELSAQLRAQLASGGPRSVALLFAGTALALLGMGLIVGSAFMVGLNRQLRMHGMLAAAGAAPTDVGTVVLLGGTLPGALASLAAALVGVAAGYAAHPFLSARVNHVVGPTALSPPLLIGAVLLGIAASTLAALLPARHAARVPPIQALAGRVPAPAPPGRVAFVGLVILAFGAVGTVLSLSKRGRSYPLLGPLSPSVLRPIGSKGGLALSLIAMIIGCLLAIPLAVRLLRWASGVFPTSARLAARELGRHPRRTGAAVVAATVALAVPVLVSAWAGGQNTLQRRHPDLGNNQLLFSSTQSSPAQSDAEAAFRKAFPGARVGGFVNGAGGVEQPTGDSFFTVGTVIGGPDLLDVLGAGGGAAALARGAVVQIGPPGSKFAPTVQVMTGSPVGGPFYAPPGSSVPPSPVPLALPPATTVPSYGVAVAGYGSLLPSDVISPATAASIGLTAQQDGGSYQIVIALPGDVNATSTREAMAVAASEIGYVETEAQSLFPTHILWEVWGGALGLALAIVIVVIALVS